MKNANWRRETADLDGEGAGDARTPARARAFGRPGRQRVGRDDDDCLKDFGARYNFYKYLCLRHLRRAGKVRSCLRGAAGR